MSIRTILECINKEDKTVPYAVEKSIPQIEALVKMVVQKMKTGGRLFYIGAGTSGRLGIVDASECPPTFGAPHDLVVGLIAGGDTAIRKAVEFAEDDKEQAWKDLSHYNINIKDVVIGIAASGRTPYVVGGLELCQKNGITTGCITNNPFSEITRHADYPVTVVVGPEFITGSTRMKCGTAQKLVLNMISTSVMIQLGKVKGNKMIDMQPSNTKLIDRGIRMLMEELCIEKKEAEKLLKEFKQVRKAIDWYKNNQPKT
jgi:N-acetylmuramic acid 6-phosphate etherase